MKKILILMTRTTSYVREIRSEPGSAHKAQASNCWFFPATKITFLNDKSTFKIIRLNQADALCLDRVSPPHLPRPEKEAQFSSNGGTVD